MVLMEEKQGMKERKAEGICMFNDLSVVTSWVLSDGRNQKRWKNRGGCTQHNGVWSAQDTLISFESLINEFVDHQQY